MTIQQAQDWGGFLMGAKDLRVTLRIGSLDAQGDRIDASLEGSYEYEEIATGRGIQRPVTFRATFLRDGSTWRLTSLR